MKDMMLSDWVRAIRDLARRTGLEELLDAADIEMANFRRDRIYVVFAGGANCGKSTRINGLLGRKILPVSSMRSSAGISIWAGEDEGAVIDGEKKPLSALGDIHQQVPPKNVEVSLTHEWLNTKRLCIVERLPLEASDDDVVSTLEETLCGADLVVHLIDALMPVSRIDAALLAECSSRDLPLIVALSKGDHLSNEERSTVLQYVIKHVAETGLKVSVIDTEANTSSDDLRASIDNLVQSIDLTKVRLQQSKEGLLRVLDKLELAAHAGLEAQDMNSRERATELKKREQQFEAQDLGWTDIEQRLEVRRHKVDDQVRQHLDHTRAATLDALLFDLERSRNVRQWWDKDLHFRLQRELKVISSQVSNSISRHVAGDIRWLQEQLHRRFNFPISAPLAEPVISVNDVQIDPSHVALANMRSLRIASRIGTAATVALAGLVLREARIGGVILAVSSISGLVAEQIAQRLTDKDRSAIRAELDRFIQKVWLEYASQISERLKCGYEEIINSMKKEQERWHESQRLALSRALEDAPNVDWQHVLTQTQALAAKMIRRGDV